MAVLMKVNGSPPHQLIELKPGENVIGRHPDCDLILDLSGVSRRHAVVKQAGRDYVLVDLESRNKTYLNERLVTPMQDHLLRSGDRILICDVELVYYPQAPEGPTLDVTEAEAATICAVDASDSDALRSAKPEAQLRAILEISRNLSSSLKLDAVAPKTLDSLLEIFPQAERVFLVLLKPGEAVATIRQFFHKLRPERRGGPRGGIGRGVADEARMSISRTIMNAVINQKKAVLSQDAGNDQNLPTSASIADLRIRSFMCAPLLSPDHQALGILQIDTTDRKQFTQEDLDVLVAVASQASIAVQNASMHEGLLARERLDRDLRLAEQVQRRFLPQGVPKVPGFEFYAHYQAAYEVGGDYYDFVPLPGGRLALAVGDVAGKGVAAALMMAKFSGDTRYCILTETAPGPAADQLNILLYEAGLDERFITLCLGVLEPELGRFTFCSAGHLPVLIRRADGTVEEVGDDLRGFPLGIMPTSDYQQRSVDLAPGDVALVYSDGVTDGRSPRDEIYVSCENDRLRKRLATAAGGPEAVGRAIIQDIREFCAGQPQADDITLISFGPVAK
jgi:serine phosphatase RsbU (regulator of sigma subunit)/pSer/pThr/pTyr-binding forkhead associated (FHA) protein